MIQSFNNSVLDRFRTVFYKFAEADVYIARGDLNGETLPRCFGEFEAFFQEFQNIGVNGKNSPEFNDEDIVEEIDYETEVVGIKAQGNIIVKRISEEFLIWLSDELQNQRVTLFIVPKNPVTNDICLFIEGVKLTKKLEGKANSDNSPQVVFSYMRRADKITDVYKIYTIPE